MKHPINPDATSGRMRISLTEGVSNGGSGLKLGSNESGSVRVLGAWSLIDAEMLGWLRHIIKKTAIEDSAANMTRRQRKRISVGCCTKQGLTNTNQTSSGPRQID